MKGHSLSSQHYPKAGENPYPIPVVGDPGWGGLEIFNYGIGIMCRTISISNVHLQAFSIGYPDEIFRFPHWGPYKIYPATFVFMSPGDLEHMCRAFQSFRKISLRLGFDLTDERHGKNLKGRGNENRLIKILVVAKDLNELRLNVCVKSDLFMPKRVSGFLYLTTFAASTYNITLPDMMYRLIRHSPDTDETSVFQF
jgi:hypothetical protein